VKSNVPGRASVDGVAACRRQPIAGFDCIVKPGEYVVSFDGDFGAQGSRKVDARKGAGAASFTFGFIEAKAGAKVKRSANGVAVSKIAFEEGKRTVFVIASDGTSSSHQVSVSPGKTSFVP
jgi:hypothetical protein